MQLSKIAAMVALLPLSMAYLLCIYQMRTKKRAQTLLQTEIDDIWRHV